MTDSRHNSLPTSLSPIRNWQRGVSLIVAVIFTGFLATVVAVTLIIVTNNAYTAANHIQSKQAFWLAEAGLEAARRWLRTQPVPPPGTAPFIQFDQVAFGNGAFTVEIDPDDSNPNNYLKTYVITSTGEVGELRRRISYILEIRPFSRYAYLTNSEGGTIWFTTGDLIEGPLHSNDRISIQGHPIFQGKVTSSASSFRKGTGYNPDFCEGYQLNVPAIALPDMDDVIDNFEITHGGDPSLDISVPSGAKAELIFNAGGTVTYGVWRPASGGGRTYLNGPTTITVESTDGFILTRGTVQVTGTLNGSVTVVSQGNIELPNDIYYAAADADGEPAPSCDDCLGLVAAGNIIVLDTTPNRQNCVIDAALLALGNSFTVENYSSGSYRGLLTVYGSISQKTRGPVGTSGWSGQTGYSKNYHYDTRFDNISPPYFPVTDVYDMVGWSEVN